MRKCRGSVIIQARAKNYQRLAQLLLVKRKFEKRSENYLTTNRNFVIKFLTLSSRLFMTLLSLPDEEHTSILQQKL